MLTRTTSTRMVALMLAFLTGALLLAMPVVAEIGILADSVEPEAYGTYNGVEFIKYSGRFMGLASGDYSVPFEIVAPADPSEGNRAVLVETLHVLGGANVRETYLGPEFLFGQGFSHAAIGWHPDDVDPFAGYDAEQAIGIIASFATAVRQDAAVADMLGDVQQVYVTGLSKGTEPLLSLALSGQGTDLFDLWLPLVPTWVLETFERPTGVGPMMVILTEGDTARAKMGGMHTYLLRGSSATYRSYVIAGAPHVPDVPANRALFEAIGFPMAEYPAPLVWLPVVRALFTAGHEWATEGTEPPPSIDVDASPAGQLDPAIKAAFDVEVETGIARDADGNAVGGIRLPDLAVGRALYLSADPESVMMLMGKVVDLQCEPKADGSPRFADHDAYVGAFTEAAEQLVADRFLLAEEAQQMIAEATALTVGDPAACAAVMQGAPAAVAEVLVKGAPTRATNGIYVDPQQRLWVASTIGNELLVMDPESGEILERYGNDVRLTIPDDLVIGPDGTVYWTALLAGTIGKMTPDGEISIVADIGPGVNPITLSDDGRLFVGLCFMGSGLYEVDPEGVESPRAIMTDTMINGMDFGPDGYLYAPAWFEGTVLRFDVDTGEITTAVDGIGVPGALKFDSKGQMHLLDFVGYKLLKVDLETGETELVATVSQGLDNLAFDSKDRLFLTSHTEAQVVELLADGTTRVVSRGGMNMPQGVAVRVTDAGEQAYIADQTTLRVFDGETGEPAGVLRELFRVYDFGPTTVQFAGDNLLFSAWFANSVTLLDPATADTVWSWHDLAVPMNAIEFQGDIVVAQLGAGNVIRVDVDDPPQREVLADGLAIPLGLAATEDDLWVGDYATGTILQIVADGVVLEEPVTVATGLAGPEGMAVDVSGDLLVAETGAGRLSRVDLATGIVTSVVTGLSPGEAVPEGMPFPPSSWFTGVAVGPSGTIYLTNDTDSVLYRIKPARPAPAVAEGEVDLSQRTTEEVLVHHLVALGERDLDAIVMDYAEDAVIFLPDGTVSGTDAIRAAFDSILSTAFLPGTEFEMKLQLVEGEAAYILWSADTPTVSIPYGTDTFIVRDGLIVVQSYAGEVVPKS